MMATYTAKQDGYSSAIISEGERRNITPRGIKIALATVLVESNLQNYANSKVPASMSIPHDAVGSDGFSVGLFQQQVVLDVGGWWWGDAATCMDPTKSAGLFYDRLAKLDYNNISNTPGSYAQTVQQSAFPDRYDQRFNDAGAIYSRLSGAPVPTPAPVDPNRPDFNEYWVESPSSQNREGTKVDLWLIHTQEGAGNADSLAHFLANPNNQVSYHYTVSEDPNDHGVTVCDVVDTDDASWSVLSANDRSIDLCFAGSSVNWTRAQWLAQSRAIDVAAYLCVKDCLKYGITPKVIAPPYNSDPPGISDHRYVTEHLRDGTHIDVGPNFPWDVFSTAVAKYVSSAPTPTPIPTPIPTPTPTPVPAPDPTMPAWLSTLSDRQVLNLIAIQLLGPDGTGWNQLGSSPDAIKDLEAFYATGNPMTPVDALAWLKHHVSTHKNPTP